MQQLKGQFDSEISYYSDKNNELDFVIQDKTDIIIVEAKAGEDKTSPSFKKFSALTSVKQSIRYSKRGYKENGNIINIPLYLVNKTKELL